MVPFWPLGPPECPQPGEFLTIHFSLGFCIAEQMHVCVCVCVRACPQNENSTGCARSHVNLCALGSTLGRVQVLAEPMGMGAEAVLEGLCQRVRTCG